MLRMDHLSIAFGDRSLFRDVSVFLQEGKKYGLVGANGCGKTSLLNVLSKEVEPAGGHVHLAKGARLGFLRQDQALHDEERILDTVLQGQPLLWEAWQKKEQLMASSDFGLQQSQELASLEEQIARLDGYSAHSTAARLLEGLGIPEIRHLSPLKTLSGGYKLRVLLARLFFSAPDILLLDEPTNYLDIVSIRWLETYLQQFKGTVLVCSHDRDFLDTTCEGIIDIDYGTITLYEGGYEDFVEAKQLAREHREAQLKSQDKQKGHMQSFVDRFRAKSSKARQAQSRLRMIEKLQEQMEALALVPSSRQYPHLQFDLCRPSGYEPLSIDGISKSFGNTQVLNNLSFTLERGDKAAIIGPNGIGKSTLLEMIVGNLPADAGTISFGFATYFAYFPQEHYRQLQTANSLLEWLWPFQATATEQQVRSILGRVLFTKEDVQRRPSSLSGGEMARLFLAKMMLLEHNFLILDEPTNHLDLEAIDTLTEALKAYKGTVLIVSHNAYFVRELANRILEISPSGLLDYRGSYDDYLAIADTDHLQGRTIPSPVTEKVAAPPSWKQGRRDKERKQREIARLEDQISTLEAALAALEERLADPTLYTSFSMHDIAALLEEKGTLAVQLEAALALWEQKMSQISSTDHQ